MSGLEKRDPSELREADLFSPAADQDCSGNTGNLHCDIGTVVSMYTCYSLNINPFGFVLFFPSKFES